MLDAFFVPRNASNNFIDLLHKWWEIKDLAYNNAIAKANFEIERYIEIIQTIQGIDAQLAADPTNQLLIFLKDTWTQIRFAQFSIMTSSIQDLRTAYAVLSDSYADYLASWTQAEKLYPFTALRDS